MLRQYCCFTFAVLSSPNLIKLRSKSFEGVKMWNNNFQAHKKLDNTVKILLLCKSIMQIGN